MKPKSETPPGYRRTPKQEAYGEHKAKQREPGANAFATGLRREWTEPHIEVVTAPIAPPPAAQPAPAPKPAKSRPNMNNANVWLELAKQDRRDRRDAAKAELLALDSYDLSDFPEAADVRDQTKKLDVEKLSGCQNEEQSKFFIYQGKRGFRVLYARNVCFVDVDVADMAAEGGLKRRSEALAKAHRFVAINPEVGMRSYCTAAGLRYLVTSHALGANSPEVLEIMTSLGADIRYLALCVMQDVCGARLDPKPERCHLPADNYAACQFLWHIGSTAIHPEVLSVLKLHDKEANAHSGRPLA